jgi:hypothetical protein
LISKKADILLTGIVYLKYIFEAMIQSTMLTINQGSTPIILYINFLTSNWLFAGMANSLSVVFIG